MRHTWNDHAATDDDERANDVHYNGADNDISANDDNNRANNDLGADDLHDAAADDNDRADDLHDDDLKSGMNIVDLRSWPAC